MSVKEGVKPLVPLHFLVGDELTHIIAFFNDEMKEGHHQLQSDIFSKWMDVNEEVIWFNRAYNYIKNTKNLLCRRRRAFGYC